MSLLEKIKSVLDGRKTFIGLIIAATPLTAGLFGYDITPAGAVELGGLVSVLADHVVEIVTGVGLLIAAIGRLVTKAK